jgi:hypothetical protein
MRNIEELSREDLIQYLRFLSELTMAVDGLWFLAAEKATDFDRALEMDVNVWTGYASLLVKRIRKTFSVDGTGLEALKQIMRHDPTWWTAAVALTEDTPEALAQAVAPEIKVQALKLPPRNSPTEICCRWAFHT